jgi:hypothetical protein
LVDINARDQSYICSKVPYEQAFYEEIFHHAQLCKNFAEKFMRREDLIKKASFFFF